MTSLTVQYLEYAPPDATPAKVRKRLREAFEILPISTVILGWDLPYRLVEAVAEETARQKAELYRWHPLLASDAGFPLPKEWQPVNFHGDLVPGFRGLPEFTFICPNRTDVQEWITERLEVASQSGFYQGIFLDRMRFPSPAENLEAHLACFCKSCKRLASDSGLDLETVRLEIESHLVDADQSKALINMLFSSSKSEILEPFFTFRADSITRIVRSAAKTVRSHGLNVGLDCFSPTLTRMVGQDLNALNKTCDWIKLMIYPRVFGPAGLPFELRGLSIWLMKRYGFSELDAIQLISEKTNLTFSENGLDSEAVAHEIQLGRKYGISNLLAGIALVDVEKVHTPTLEQIQTDILACKKAGADGLALSWDLWHIKPKYLTAIQSLWNS